MYYNNNCCTPPKTKDCCSCKDGVLCALDWFFQDFLLKPSNRNTLKTLKYYPELPPAINTDSSSIMEIPNTIYNIPFITQDVVPVYTTPYTPPNPYCGNITYLNICEIDGFEFEFNDTLNSNKESDIITRFSKIKYIPPSNYCCKNGIMETLLKAKDFLLNPLDSCQTERSVILSTSNNSFLINQIIAINSDTVWAKREITIPDVKTVYYVLSLCKLIGITFKKVPFTS